MSQKKEVKTVANLKELRAKSAELDQKYIEKFGEKFPTFETGAHSYPDKIAKIQKCLRLGKSADEVFNIVIGKRLY